MSRTNDGAVSAAAGASAQRRAWTRPAIERLTAGAAQVFTAETGDGGFTTS